MPLSGQDGDPANLNNLALGKQYVDVWKNSNELGKAAGQAALQLCAADKDVARRSTINRQPGTGRPEAGRPPIDYKTPGGNTMKSVFLKVNPLTADKLGDVFNGRLVRHQGSDLCKGVDSSTAPATQPASSDPPHRRSDADLRPGTPQAQVEAFAPRIPKGRRDEAHDRRAAR